MEQLTMNLKTGQIKIMKSLGKVAYENKYNLEDFANIVLETGLDLIISNLTEDQTIEVIKEVAK